MFLNIFPNVSCPHFITWQTHPLSAEVWHQILHLQPTGICTIPITLMQPSVFSVSYISYLVVAFWLDGTSQMMWLLMHQVVIGIPQL